jgi:16S rRNA processing protein RimM
MGRGCLTTVPERFITLATIGAPHGVRGEVRVKSFTADPMALGAYGALFAKDGSAFEIERLRQLKGDMLVVKFRGIDDRTVAEKFNRLTLHVDRSALPAPAPDEFYHADLIGLAAVDAAGTPLGTVVAVENHGAGDIIEIAPESGPSLLLPFTKAAVPDIDVAAGRVVVAPPTEIEARPEEGEVEET